MSLEQYSKSVRETADNLRIIDDALFRLMAEKDSVCQEILRTLLDMPSLNVVNVTAQSVVKSLHREVILDAFCILENGEYINVEMQKGSGNDDVARTRFHAAALTSAYTPKGTDFADVPQVTILYITEYDALNNGQAVTHVKRCMKTKSGFVPVYAFEDAKFPEISKAVKYFKETEGGRSEVCKTVENYARSYAEEAVAEGRAEERLEAIKNMLKQSYTKEAILNLNYTEKEIQMAENAMLAKV